MRQKPGPSYFGGALTRLVEGEVVLFGWVEKVNSSNYHTSYIIVVLPIKNMWEIFTVTYDSK